MTEIRYVRVYDATNDTQYLRPYQGDAVHGLVLLSADEAKASGIPIK